MEKISASQEHVVIPDQLILVKTQKSNYCLNLHITGSLGQIYAFAILQNSLDNINENTDLGCIAIWNFIEKIHMLGGS